MATKKVEIYTDGACSGNPGPGGYGIILKYGDNIKELSHGFKETTNNRMELTAVIKGLAALSQPCEVTLYSDSKYVIDGINKGWAAKWRDNNWMRTKTEEAKNKDLWELLLNILDYHHTVEMVWVKGHADNQYNNRCDALAVEAIEKLRL